MNVNRTFLTIAALGVTGASASTYTVKDGDTLASVAEAANVEPTELLALNNLTSGTLQVGQTIKIGKSSFIKPVMAGNTTPADTTRPVVAAADAVTVALGVISAAPQSIAPSSPTALTAQSVALPAVSTAPVVKAASISAQPVKAQTTKAEPVVLGEKTDATPKRFSTPLVAAPVKTPTSSAKVVASTPVVSKFATKKSIVAAKPAQAKPVAAKTKAAAKPVAKQVAPAKPAPKVAKKPSASSQLAAQAAAKARAATATKAAKVAVTKATPKVATKPAPKTKLVAQSVQPKAKAVAKPKTALMAKSIAKPAVKAAGSAAAKAAKTALAKPVKKAAPKRMVAKVKPKKAAPRKAVAKAKVVRKKAVVAKRRISRGSARLSTAASRYLGIRYVLGGMGGRGGIDCSAYTMRVMQQLGVNLPRTSRSQWRVGRAVSSRNLRPGDLVFFNTSGRGVSHVGIYMGNGMFANANSYRGRTLIEPLFGNSYWAKRYIGARRVLN